MVTVREVLNRSDLKTFIHLPFKIHRHHKQWLPPLLSDEWKVFDKTKNHAFEHCDTVMILAEKDGKVEGRIMGIINHVYNAGHKENNARFCFLECTEDYEVFEALTDAVEKWAKDKGTEKVVGPLGFSDKDPQGFLIDGFDDPVTVMVTNHSFQYMVDFTERRGYGKKLDLFQYRSTIPEIVPDVYYRIAERVKKRGFKVLKFKNSKEIRPYVQPVFDLINETYTDIYGFAPLDEQEAREFSERFLPLLNHEYIKVVVDPDNNVVAFIVAMPDISKGFKQAKGRLFPIGFAYILRSFKTTKQLNLLLGCVKTNLQNSGIDALMTVALFESANKGKLTTLDSHLIMEENLRMRALMERQDYTIYKKYRIFEKDIS
ncbi:hypothetical protein ACE01N_00760 [Saccharicrinis sp. FJH2]|uniref:hypothetical protein n=1 Tax=Saccharicrinis sp. FJH65 TaxID=3344659 RepID=UPI0035F48AE4